MSSRGLSSIRKRLSARKTKEKDEETPAAQASDMSTPENASPSRRRSQSQKPNVEKSPLGHRRSHSVDVGADNDDNGANGEEQQPARQSRPNLIQRLRERSRSRSRSRNRRNSDVKDEKRKEMLVAVTSCRSDGYYNQKAPGSLSKLPRKAPTNLKLFHELAVGVKDAYAAVGALPKKPADEEKGKMDPEEYDGRIALFDFITNLNFVSVSTVYFVACVHSITCPYKVVIHA